MSDKQRVYVVINGILNNPSDRDGWTDRAQAWISAKTPYKCEKFEYFSGALTRRLFQAQRVNMVRDILKPYVQQGFEIVLVGHSNGCDIITRLVKSVPSFHFTELHLVAAASDHDFKRNGLALAMRQGRVGKVFCYCSRNDEALSTAVVSSWLLGWMGLGYGYLGLVGPSNAPNAGRTVTHWEDSYKHGDWWTPVANFDFTMKKIVHAV